MEKAYYVYFLASTRNGTLYVGATSDLVRRVYEHKTNAVPGFTKTYAVHHLVYFEAFDTPAAAIQREKTIKGWPDSGRSTRSKSPIRTGAICTMKS